MITQRLSLLFVVILALCPHNMFAAAEVKDSMPIMHTIGELKREKMYPTSKELQKQFLLTLYSGLNSQVKAVNALVFDQLFAIDIHNRAQSYQCAYEESKYSKDIENVLSESPALMAFLLHYGADKSLFRPDEFDPRLFNKMKQIVADWQDCDDEYIREYIDLSNRYWDLLYLSYFRSHAIVEPLMHEKIAIEQWVPHNFQAIYNHEKSPLKFLRHALSLRQIYQDVLCVEEIVGVIHTGVISEWDKIYFDATQLMCVEYAAMKPYIALLRKGIEREYELLTSKAKSKTTPISMSFIDTLPAIRAEQKPKRPQRTKKKKGTQLRTVTPLITPAVEPCSSTDIPQSVAPEVGMSVEYQENVTPEILLRNAMLPMAIKRAFERIEHPDGSFTVAEDATRVELYDAPNQQKIKLFKVEKSQQLYLNPNYTAWVQKWFTAPEEALAQQGYNDTTSDRFKHRATAKAVHGFTPLVDRYLPYCSTQSQTLNRYSNRADIVVTIPGMMKGKCGLFLFIIDSSTGQWYHRNWQLREGHVLLAEYRQKGYYDVEFPELR